MAIVNAGETLSLLDVIDEERELQDAANAVLGGADDRNCTYSSGYVKRQAIYACATCSTEPNAICFACSLHCHEGHKLYELYTKRNLRCDCGSEKVLPNACRLLQNKEPFNSENIYNHNFYGRYCTCDRPYPDSEDEVEDVMIQCITCEDWFHARHLGCAVPPVYEEMVCDGCMERLPFLRSYQMSRLLPVELDSEVDPGPCVGAGDILPADQTTVVVKDTSLECVTCKPSSTSKSLQISSSSTSEVVADGICDSGVVHCPTTLSAHPGFTQPDSSSNAETESYGSSSVHTQSSVTSSSQSERSLVASTDGGGKTLFEKKPLTCFLKKSRDCECTEDLAIRKGAGFFLEGWRSSLCHCPSCEEMYTKEKVRFLCDPEDTVAIYESRGRGKECDVHEAGMVALTQQLSRVEQVEMIHEFNFMKERLKCYLKKFAEEDKVVGARDIDEFFGDLKAHKRRRLENAEGLPPSRCH